MPTTLRSFAFVLALVLVPTTVAAQSAQTPVTATGELQEQLRSVNQASVPAVQLAHTLAAMRLSGYVPRTTYLGALDDAANGAKDPRAAFVLMREAAWTRHHVGDDSWGTNGMVGPLGEQGCLRDWELVGPFENASMSGMETAFGPELGEVGPYTGKLTEIDWREHPDDWDDFCSFDLGRVVAPEAASVAYLATTVSVEEAQDALLFVGARGAYRVWVNGKLVGDFEEDFGIHPDRDAWKVKLEKGVNDVLVKIGSTGDGGLGFMARLVEARTMKPIAFETSGQWRRNRVEPEGRDPLPDPRGVLAQVRLTATSDSANPNDAMWAAWYWRTVAYDDPATPWRAVAERLLKNPEALTPRTHALAAQLFEEYWYSRDVLRAAAERAPEDPFIVTSLGAKLEDGITERDAYQAAKLYRDVLGSHPDFVLARLALAGWLSGRGLDERALDLLRDWKTIEHLEIPAYLGSLRGLEESQGSLAEARALDDAYASINALSTQLLAERVRDHMLAEEPDRALERLDAYLAYEPDSHWAALQKVEVLRADGRLDEAMQLVESRLANSPGNVGLHRKLAQLQVASGDATSAAQTVEVALRHRPQDSSLREYLAHLRPEENRFHEEWMVEDVRAIADANPPQKFDQDTIVEQTITYVAPNGLAQNVVQNVTRAITQDGVDSARSTRVAYQTGDERVDILRVRVHKPDGTFSEDYDQWESGSSRKRSTTYNDTGYVNIRANDVDPGDLVEFRWRVSQVANANFRGDYFGDIAYLQGRRPIAFQRYAVIYPERFNLFFRPPAIEHERTDGKLPAGKAPEKGYKVTSFEMEKVPHVDTDPMQPGYTDVYDYLLVSNKKTWDDIGEWWWELVKEQLIVDEEIRSKVEELTDGLDDEDAKIAAIHNYVVKNTRYLHVGLGIHGWKPYRTTACFRNRYGDCKDKAALLKVMLETAGIPANLVLVRTRRLGHVDDDPASMHVFNHAITYVPGKDLYLDGTAEFNGTNELTTMDQGAQALVVKDGGETKWVTLPVDEPSDNVLRQTMEVDLTGEKPRAVGSLEATGANAVYFRQALQDPERRDEVFEERLASDYPGAELVEAEYENLSDLEAPTKIDFTFEGGQLLRKDGERAYLYPIGQPKDFTSAYARRASRNQDLSIRVPFENRTLVRWKAPSGANFDYVPRNVSIDSKFGFINVAYRREGDELVADVRYAISVQRVPVEEYAEFREFMTEMTSALNETIRLGQEE